MGAGGRKATHDAARSHHSARCRAVAPPSTVSPAPMRVVDVAVSVIVAGDTVRAPMVLWEPCDAALLAERSLPAGGNIIPLDYV